MKPHHIIIADDDWAVSELFQTVVKEQYPTAILTMATNGVAALGAYTAGGADLLILDVMMPVMTGLEVRSTLRARNDGIPIILTSSLHRHYQTKDLATAFFTKPIHITPFLSTMHHLLTIRENG